MDGIENAKSKERMDNLRADKGKEEEIPAKHVLPPPQVKEIHSLFKQL